MRAPTLPGETNHPLGCGVGTRLGDSLLNEIIFRKAGPTSSMTAAIPRGLIWCSCVTDGDRGIYVLVDFH